MDYQDITEIYQEIQKSLKKDPECQNLIYNYQINQDYRELSRDFIQELDFKKEVNLICDKSKLKQELKTEINRQLRYNGNVSLIILHFDLLKSLKEKSNYRYWDTMFLRLSEIISRKIRKVDILARWSRDILIIINPNTRLNSAINLGKRISREIDKQKFDGIGNFNFKFGVTALRPQENCIDLLDRVEPAIDLLRENGEINLYIFS